MALIFNNASIPQSGAVVYNGTALKNFKYGSTEMWKKSKDIYNTGNQNTALTGGFTAYQTYGDGGSGAGTNWNSTNCYQYMLYGGSQAQVRTNNPVSFTGFSTLNLAISAVSGEMGWNGRSRARLMFSSSSSSTVNNPTGSVWADITAATTISMRLVGYQSNYYVYWGISTDGGARSCNMTVTRCWLD